MVEESNPSISIEDATVIKLMEEVMEFDQEIKMKQRQINTRLQLLHRLLPNHEGKNVGSLVSDFM